jgi:hypothetical protein
MTTTSQTVRYFNFDDLPTVRELLRMQGVSRIGEANTSAFFRPTSLILWTATSLALLKTFGWLPEYGPWKEAFLSPDQLNGIVAWIMALPMFALVGIIMLAGFYLRHRRAFGPDDLAYESVEDYGSSGRQGLWLAEDEYGAAGCIGLRIEETKETTPPTTAAATPNDADSRKVATTTQDTAGAAVGRISHFALTQSLPPSSTIDAALIAHVLRVAFERPSEKSPDAPLGAVKISLYASADKSLVNIIKLFGFKKTATEERLKAKSLLDRVWPISTAKREYIIERSVLGGQLEGGQQRE